MHRGTLLIVAQQTGHRWLRSIFTRSEKTIPRFDHLCMERTAILEQCSSVPSSSHNVGDVCAYKSSRD